jgi:hypothetical protein
MTWSDLTTSIDLAVFDQLRDESEVITYLYNGGGSSTIPAVVLSEGTRREPESGLNLYNEAAFVVQSGAFTGTQPQVGDNITHDGKTYTVSNYDLTEEMLTIYAIVRVQKSQGTSDSARLLS